MLLIFTPKHTNRTRYVFSLICHDILGQEIDFTCDEEEFLNFQGPKINYSERQLEDGIYFKSTEILFERGIAAKELSFVEYNDCPAFFPVYDDNAVMPFDPFAASFYLVSRYEEYMPFVRDEYGRFQAEHSIAFQKGFLGKPLINIWADQIYGILKNEYPAIDEKKRKYRFFPTIDINSAYLYRSKGTVRSAGGFIKSLGDLDFKQFMQRLKVLARIEKDPFETYTEQLEIHKKYDLNTIYFILFANYGPNDKNISVNNRRFQIFIKSIADYCRVGLHSSYASIHDPEQLRIEVERLSSVINREVELCRQHFLVLNIPMTYRNMLNLDIKEDFSMGYVNKPGFRAGICSPFYFYDLDIDSVTNLKVNPFAVMDAPILYNGSQLSDYQMIIDEVKKVKGKLISIWNNESLVHDINGRNGMDIYERFIKMAVS